MVSILFRTVVHVIKTLKHLKHMTLKKTDETRFIVSRKGDEVQPALEAAMKTKMAAELDVLDDI